MRHRAATDLDYSFSRRPWVRRAPLMAADVVTLSLLQWGVRPGVVVGDSMSPTLRSGQWFLIDPDAYRASSPRRGEIVVFRHRGITYVKRVLGAGGDTVWLLSRRDADGVYLTPVSPDLMSRARLLSQDRAGWRLLGLRVPRDHVYVIGDLIPRSVDSRQLGPIPVGELRGRVRLLHRESRRPAGRPLPPLRAS